MHSRTSSPSSPGTRGGLTPRSTRLPACSPIWSDLPTTAKAPSAAVRKSLPQNQSLAGEGRRLLAAWQEATDRTEQMFEAADDVCEAGGTAEAMRGVNDAAKATAERQYAVERKICAFALAALGRTSVEDGSEAAVSIDGWLFVIAPSPRPGEPSCQIVVRPGSVLFV